jgi:pteridine reductase
VACEVFQADVSQESEVDRMFQTLAARFGRLDALVTTASIWEPMKLEDVTAEHVLRSFQVNTLGTFLCARRAGLMMVDQVEGGAIVTVGDWAIKRPYLHHSAYFLAKGAIPSLTRSLAVELAERNPKVRVNCIHPGPVLFPPDASQEEQHAMRQSTLVRMANCPESIGHAVQFLIENPFVTGVCLPVDGGRSVFAGEQRYRERPI